MKAEELMQGNLLYSPSLDENVEVVGYYRHGFGKTTIIVDASNLKNVHIVLSQLQPIPLTEEWLVKFGFKKRENYYHIGHNPITHDWLFYITKLSGDDYFFYRNGFHKLLYVHQLQNLYKILTGETLCKIS